MSHPAPRQPTPPIGSAARLPPLPVRYAQALALKLGWLGWPGCETAEPGRPLSLVRVDEFPHAQAFDPAGRFGTAAFQRFHAVLADAGVPYLLAVTPRISRDYLDPGESLSRPLDAGEVEALQALRAPGVTFALHGLDHRTRHASPRRHSELCGLGLGETAARIDQGLAGLAEAGVEAPVFVPPFNRFDARQYELLAERFAVICGGPESVRLLGLLPGPVRLRGAVYLPSYPPLYGRAADVAPALERMLGRGRALWAPVTLHWGWELEDDFAGLRRLCAVLARCASGWPQLLATTEGEPPGAVP